MRRLLSAFIAVCTCFACLNAQQTKILTADKNNEYGLVYSLPTTGLKIKVTAEKKTVTAGPYYQFAKKCIGVSNVPTRNTTSWNITKIDMVPVGVNDDNNKYLMQLKPGALTYIGVDANGMLLSINAEPEAVSPAPVTNTVKAKGSGNSDASIDDYLQYVDMDFVSSQSSMKQAEMIASSLMDVRDAYLSLTRGTADNMPSDGRQLELMLSSLRQQEAALTRAFTGFTATETFEREYLYIPEADGREILFRLSDFSGFVEPDDYSGFPVYISTEILLEGTMPVDANGEEKKLPKDAVIYSLPGTAKITVSAEGETLYETETEFAQFGKTFGLAPNLFTDKKAPSFAIFNPATGGLLEIGKVSSGNE